jgi:hypothetical protein
VPDILPRAYGCVAAGAKEVTLRFAARGEGYHAATLYNPAGAPVGRVSRFVEFEDPGRYELELKVPAAEPLAGWALETQALEIVSCSGLLPYWSASPDTWFNPEQEAEE